MNNQQAEQFRKEYKSIVYQYSELMLSNKRLKNLHAWDKNDSHKGAILKELRVRENILGKLTAMLKGRDYEEWKFTSSRLSKLVTRLKRATERKIKCETEINNINFEL